MKELLILYSPFIAMLIFGAVALIAIWLMRKEK